MAALSAPDKESVLHECVRVCVGSFVGRVVTEPCDSCGHMLCVHMADRSCSICCLIAYLTDPDNCITPPTQSGLPE